MSVIDKIREMEPLNRRFTSAALGVGTAVLSASLGFLPGIVAALGSGFLIDKYSHVKDDPNTYEGMKLNSPDYWKNVGSWAAAYLVIAMMIPSGGEPQQEPEVIGEQLGMGQVTEQDNVRLADAPVLTYKPA